MKAIIIGIVTLMLGLIALLAVALTRYPPNVTTISPWWADSAFQQCSREVPKGGPPYWTPSAKEIAALETDLWPLLETRAQQGLRVPDRFIQFRRQYLGFTRNGERLIYGNFAPSNKEFEWQGWPLLERPFLVCDGGPSFWGIVYNPVAKSFEEPAFNGQI